MKRFVAFVAVAAMALVLVAMPAFAVAGVNGAATTDNTILNVKVGSTVVKLATDLAHSLNTSTLKATGSFLTGEVAGTPLPGDKTKTATKSSESGSASIADGVTENIAGIGSVTLKGGAVGAKIGTNQVKSSVDFALVNANALAGLVNIGTVSSTTDSTVATTSSIVSRDVSIGNVSVLDLRSLLGQLGIDPLALACAAIENVNDALTGAANTACSELSSVTTGITDGNTSIDDTETIVNTLESALAVPCGLVPICGTLFSQIDALQSDIDAIQADPRTTCVTVDDALGTVSGGLDTVISTLTGLTSDPTIGAALSALLAPVTAQGGALDTATSTLDTACNTLLGTVDSVLDTTLLSLDLIKVTMDLAAKSGPTAAVAGTIGALKVGTLTVVPATDLVALGDQLNSAIDTVEGALGTVLSATGLGLSAPSLDLLKATHSAGKNSSGAYFAKGAMSVAHLAIPAASVSLPSTNPLDVLSGLGNFGAAAVHVSAVNTPAVSVDAGVFSGTATFQAAPKNNPGALANTGVGDSSLVLAGMLTLIGAAFLRRITRLN